jgi:hypothetical protein
MAYYISKPSRIDENVTVYYAGDKDGLMTHLKK